MKRREVLAVGAATPLVTVRKWLRRLFSLNQGEVVEKRLVGIGNGGEEELAVVGSDSTTVAEGYNSLLGDKPGQIGEQTVTSLRTDFRELVYKVAVQPTDDSLLQADDGGPVIYRTSRILFSGMEIGDHATFQTSLLRPRTIISLSCLADSRSALKHRCPVNIDDPTEGRDF